VTSTLVKGTALLAALLAATGCLDDTSGALRVVMTSPNLDDGAVMFEVTGDVESVAAPAGLTLYQTSPGSNVIRAIVTGNIASGGNVLTLHVTDVGKASSITAQLLQVAARTTWAQRPVGAYTLQVQR